MMKKLKKISVAVLFFAVFVAGACGDDSPVEPTDNPDETPDVTEPEKLTTDPNKTFVHDGGLHTTGDFARMKAKIDAAAEPWLSGWNKLIANSHASSTYTPSPVATLIRGGNSTEEPNPDNYATAFNDAAAAYQTAIRWRVTGDVAYANTSIKILNAWASTCTKLSGNSNVALASGIYGAQFAIAAEMMRGYEGWNQEDFEAFQQWMLNVFYPVCHAFLESHWGTCISHYWANWDLANINAVMAIGVLTDDAALYNEGIDYLMNGGGNGNLDKAIYYVHSETLAQIQESGRDQGHALLCIALMGQIAQLAWNQGDDVFGYDDNKLLKAAEYSAKYNIANLSVPFQPYNNCDNVNHTVISDAGRGGKRPEWELLYNHYVKRKGLSAPYTAMAAGVVRPEGGGGDYGPNSGGYDQLGFGTLLYSLE